MNSAYYEVIKKNDEEILLLFEPHDETVMLILGQFKQKSIVGIEQESQKDQHKDDIIIEGWVKLNLLIFFKLNNIFKVKIIFDC